MRTSIATVCLSGTLEEKMHACAAAGFDGIEIFEQDLVVSPLSPEEVRALAARLGLSLDLYQPFRDADGVTEDVFEENLRRAEAKFRLMNRLGIDTMLVCSNVATITIHDDDVIAGQLRRLGELAQRHGVRIAYEALAWGTYVSTYRHAQRIVELAGHPAVGTCLDSFHILSRGDDPSGIELIDPERIFFVQLADAPALTMDVLSWSRHYRLFPGQGVFDLPAFLAHLVRAGYDGPVSLEIFNDTFRQSDAVATARDGLRSLRWLQDRAASAVTGDPARRMALDALPPTPAPTRLDFAEIRTEEPEAVAQLLDQLGFSFRGQHRRKPVQLWTQGDARIVLNGQQARGVAASISALGVQSADPDRALERALALQGVAVPRHHTADEAPLVGVAAPDGITVFFSPASDDPVWTAEFGSAPTADAGRIRGIDHVNLAQPWDAFDESVLFYDAVLQLRSRPSTEVPSPVGLVRSQVLESGGIRLALNIVPQVLDTASRYPEHIALATDDVVAVARAARDAGMEFLAVPDNYYEDLAARCALPDDLLSTLRELDLLYDTDGDGAFLHFYTATVGRMFFEVVERQGGYDGFGAPNAAVRLAAQFERTRRQPAARR
ncbi:sugar phosphate isomerase/epimerase and 4-hydroxyphenylpyruvate domain-containing protein [Microbacterium gilvum]|uniref:3-dehydroshikimate dehydratase n=1 Tax=Microbacterium gilvum TaxID=1336204 RepID=A0ABP9ADL6_9MICO